MDLFGPLKTSMAGNAFVLVLMDAFTKLAEITAIPDKSAPTVARAFFERWICRYSVPKCFMTDNGTEFANAIMLELAKLMGTNKIDICAYAPWVNSSAESYNRQIKKYLSTILDNQHTLDWQDWLPCLQFSYNIHVHKTMLESPFFMTYHHDP